MLKPSIVSSPAQDQRPAKAVRRAEEREYRPFPRETGRDDTHGNIEVPLMCRLLGVPLGQRILEIGSGVGASLTALGRLLAPRRLVGVDIGPEAARLARDALSRAGVDASVVVADVRNLPFERASFDWVFDFGTCYHIARPAHALWEITRVLRPGGQFIAESRLNQLTSHLIRAWGRELPWPAAPALAHRPGTMMWCRRERV